MQRYKDHRPTGFDRAGAFLEDQQDWFVLPVNRTRDTGTFSESNFETALEILGGESDTVEVHRFGHWGPGWYEIILISPQRESEGNEIEARLADYPILSESDLSDRTWNAVQEYWEQMRIGERVTMAQDEQVGIFSVRPNREIPERIFERLQTYVEA